jgi:hypothetical protein
MESDQNMERFKGSHERKITLELVLRERSRRGNRLQRIQEIAELAKSDFKFPGMSTTCCMRRFKFHKPLLEDRKAVAKGG